MTKDTFIPPVTQVLHPIPPIWNSESRILILGTMPSPKSREAGFYYMHPQNRFWNVLSEVFDEQLAYTNTDPITERRTFLLCHHLAMWDVLASCQIEGAADSSIKNAVPNDFTRIFENSNIHNVFCTGKTAFTLWKKYCAALYEDSFNLTVHSLPSTSPVNAQWSKERLVEKYMMLAKLNKKGSYEKSKEPYN